MEIKHILKDGRVLRDIKGLKVPINEDTMPFYMSIIAYVKDNNKNTLHDKTA